MFTVVLCFWRKYIISNFLISEYYKNATSSAFINQFYPIQIHCILKKWVWSIVCKWLIQRHTVSFNGKSKPEHRTMQFYHDNLITPPGSLLCGWTWFLLKLPITNDFPELLDEVYKTSKLWWLPWMPAQMSQGRVNPGKVRAGCRGVPRGYLRLQTKRGKARYNEEVTGWVTDEQLAKQWKEEV